MEIALLVLLILINGVFAMSEMSVVSSRRARLQNLADEGHAGAEAALSLQQEPGAFLSAVQVGITSVGILSGALGEAALADPLHAMLDEVPLLAPYANGIALTITVVCLTYFSVVVGELVPKRLALLAPESIASLISRPMRVLARVTYPVVLLLSGTCTLILKLLGARAKDEPPVTNEEIKVMMEQGAEAGVFHENEHAIVSNVLHLDDQSVVAIMSPRRDMLVIDLEEDEDVVKQQIVDSEYSRLVVCRNGLDKVIGILQTGDLLKKMAHGHGIRIADIEAVLRPPLYVPASISTAQLLENFRAAHLQLALVVDEYGHVQGLVTMTDVLAAIVGGSLIPQAPEDRDILQREDGSWLINGDVTIGRFKTALGLTEEFAGEDARSYNTVGGFIMHVLGRIPAPTDHFEANGWRFEVMDMDHNRIDKVLVSISAS